MCTAMCVETAREHTVTLVPRSVSLCLGRRQCARREVHHCRMGGCGWDRTCGAVRASPPLTSLLIRQVACRRECCIAAEAQRANQERKLHTREESQVENRTGAALSFPWNCRAADPVTLVKL